MGRDRKVDSSVTGKSVGGRAAIRGKKERVIKELPEKETR